jgi:hypothetical protein
VSWMIPLRSSLLPNSVFFISISLFFSVAIPVLVLVLTKGSVPDRRLQGIPERSARLPRPLVQIISLSLLLPLPTGESRWFRGYGWRRCRL